MTPVSASIFFNNCQRADIISRFTKRVTAALETFFDADTDASHDTTRLFYQIKKPAHGTAVGKKIVHDEDMFAGFQIFL